MELFSNCNVYQRNEEWISITVIILLTLTTNWNSSRVLDTEKLGKVISQHLDTKIHDPELEPYYSAGCNGVVLLLKCEKTDDK